MKHKYPGLSNSFAESGDTRRAKGPGQKRDLVIFLWPCSLLAGWVYGLWFLCPGTSEGSTGSGSGFKLSQKTGPRLKVSSGRLVEAGNRTYVLVLRREHLEMKVATLAPYRSAILIGDPLTYQHHF